MLRVAINGFGRIGRMFLRTLIEGNNDDISIVAINDIGDVESLIHLFKYDSTHGRFKGDISVEDSNRISIEKNSIEFFSETNPQKLPWRALGIDLVIECSGHFKEYEKAFNHIEAGAKKVLISTIAENVDRTVVYGVNHSQISKNDKIISNASCTSNCLISTLYALNSVGVKFGHMTSVHAYTSDQPVVDMVRPDKRRSRAIGVSMIPSTTNASKALELIMPELLDKIHCTAIRVPAFNVSMMELNFCSRQSISIQDINNILIGACQNSLKDVLGCSEEALVSIDFNGDPRSAVFDLTQTQVTEGMSKVVAWYDNEWAYANRLCDVARYIYEEKLY